MVSKDLLVCVVGASVMAVTGCSGDGGASERGDSVGIETGEGNDNAEAAEANEAEGDGDPTTTNGEDPTGDGDPTTTNGEDPTGDGDDDTGANPKWDITTIPDAAFNCGNGGGDEDPEFSFLWAANSTEGTISKIDTKTVTEVGRFMTRADSNGSPSRTSVSLSGHVAVANRNGGITKIYANTELCEESNGMPGIQTSVNNQALAWNMEECRAWSKDMAYASQRPAAWGLGEFNQGTCQWEEEELWTAGTNQAGTIDVYVLDGDDGTTKEMVALPASNQVGTMNNDFYGIYGGAVDGNGDFWGTQLGGGKLVRVNRADMTYDIFEVPSGGYYGMTVDNEGIVWMCSSTLGRFDPATEQFTSAQVGGYTGCMADAAEGGLLWMSTGSGVIGVNRDTMQVEKTWQTGGSYGVSIDFEGYVWTVAYGNSAYKVDPDSGQVWSYNGLVGAYTYSDMTGYALSNAGTPSG